MKYVSIDIETTGLNPENCQIIQFGAVIDDLSIDQNIEDMPQLLLNIDPGTIHGEPYALEMNKEILKEIEHTKPQHKVYLQMLPLIFKGWLERNGFMNEKPTLAGKNIAMFDLRFLEKLDDWKSEWFRRRILDPSCLWMEPQVDKELPNLNTCLSRAGADREVTHNALEDAIDVVSAIRGWFYPKDL